MRDDARAAPLTPDICIVGAGSGGLSLAAAASAFGAEVVLVERGTMGGDCLNTGCVPSKALIAAARHVAAIRAAPAFGIHAGEPSVDFPAVMAHVRGVIEEIAPADSAERFTAMGVQVIREHAGFLDADTLSAGPHRIRARRFVLATGSAPRLPDIAGIETVPVLTNETLFGLDALPRHLLVLGGGPVGLEMAQAFRRLGSAVTVVDSGEALGKEDRALAAVVLARLRSEGVDIFERTPATAVSGEPGAIALAITRAGIVERLEGTHLLAATGRRASVEGLGLEAAGIVSTASGIVVGPDLRTANRRVYAIGDAIDGARFTHVANQHAGLLARALLFRLPIRQTPDALPRVTFTDPELAQVGLTEDEARARGWAVETLTVPFSDNDRARTERMSEGLVKLVVGRRGRLIGAGIVGPCAGEIANIFSLALSQKMGMRQLAGFISPYPTFSEIGKRAATAYFAPHAKNGVVRATVRFLSRFG